MTLESGTSTPSDRRVLDKLAIAGREFDFESIPTSLDGEDGWMHSGIAVLGDGTLVVAHQEGGALVLAGPGVQARSVTTDLTEMHCITAAPDETLWIADNGHRYVHGTPDYSEVTRPGRVVRVGLDGVVVQELADPGIGGPWSPTSVSVTEGSVWVADGYGSSLIHRFDSDGSLRDTIDGGESGLRFACPHGILVRGGELYVADRENRRIVVFAESGVFRRTVGEGVVHSPSSLADLGGTLLVTELFGSLALFEHDVYAGHLGVSPRSHLEPGWPNRVVDGTTMAPAVDQGKFNSPHGIAVHDGSVYVTEWMIGGRVVWLRPRPVE
nr:hypothetical protein [Rhodococcus sp. (in: high G+C Gram-positive bacteria)]